MLTREEALNMVVEATGQEPSEEQKKVILASGGKAIMACAGSGKTTVLTTNLAVDLLTGAVDPNKLLCTTYSKAGATEMQERTEALLKKVGVYAKIEVRTMHSTYFKVLRDFGIVKDVISNSRRRMFIAEACREAKIKLGDDDLDTIDSLLSYQVNNLLDDKGLYNSYVFTLENVTLEQYGAVRNGYNVRKTANNLIDFDDMQMYMYMLLVRDKNPAVLEYCHTHWQHFYVDEFQDISKIQFAILQAMVTDPQKLMCIGDDDQCSRFGTKVLMRLQEPNIEQVRPGDYIKAYDGRGLVDKPVSRTNITNVNEPFVSVTMESGRSLEVTREHIGFAKVSRRKSFIYLLYRFGYGYRIGTRVDEDCDMAYVLDLANSAKEKLALASWFCNKYRVGLLNGAWDMLDTYEKEVKKPGGLVDQEGIDLDYPTYIKRFSATPNWPGNRALVELRAYGATYIWERGATAVYVACNDRAVTDKLQEVYGLEKVGPAKCKVVYDNVDDAEEALGLVCDLLSEAEKTVVVTRKMQVGTVEYIQLPFCNIQRGMELPTVDGHDRIQSEVIRNRSYVWREDKAVDLTVPFVQNFVANGILVHNCIYQWRGAAPQFIQNICGYFPLQKFILSTNYRCAGEIVDRAAVGITNNSQRVEKSMQAFNKGGNIWVVPTEDSLLDISQKALEYIEWLCNEKGATPNDIAVLGRNNVHMALLGNMLMRKEYYVNATEGTKLSTTPAFKDIKSVIAIANNVATAEDVKSTLWRCVSFLGVSTARNIGQFMQETMCSPRQAIGYILNECFAYSFVKPADSNIRVPLRVAAKVRSNLISANANGIQNLMAFYEMLTIEDDVERIGKCLDAYYDGIGFMYKTADRSRWIYSVVKYMKTLLNDMGTEKLQAFIHLTEQTEQANTVVPDWCGRVTLSTIHGSKGREWKYVLILADDNKSFPSYDGIMTMEKRGVSKQDISNSLDEGRRLHYVAMTRAKVALAVFAPVDNLGVYLCESFGLIDKGETEGNVHIISMAERGQPFQYTEKVKKAFEGKEGWTHLDLWDKEEADKAGEDDLDDEGGTEGDMGTDVSEALSMMETETAHESSAGHTDVKREYSPEPLTGPSIAKVLGRKAYETAEDTWGTDEEDFVNPYEN